MGGISRSLWEDVPARERTFTLAFPAAGRFLLWEGFFSVLQTATSVEEHRLGLVDGE